MRVLIVDDSALTRKLLKRELQQHGFETAESVSAEDALEQLGDFQPEIIILDVEMPGMNGFELCSILRMGTHPLVQPYPNLTKIPIIFLTSLDTPENKIQGFQAGASDFVIKPTVPGEIIKAINALVSQKNELEGLTALVVDDSSLARKAVVSALSNRGLKILEAEDGQEGLKQFSENADKIDLVITDYLMPNVDGIALCHSIRNELGFKDVPIIFLTSITDKESITNIYRSGATDYLIKPFSKEELFARLHAHLKVKSLTDTLHQKIRQLKEADKLKDEFLSIASHDLRSPINGILGFCSLLLDDKSLSKDTMESLGFIQQSGRFLLNLINDLLELSRLQSEKTELNPVPLKLSKILESSAQTLEHMARPKHIHILSENRFIGPEPMIMADRNALTQIINNLLSNALKFTHPGGKVSITIEPDGEDKIAFSVIDSGIGIPKEDLPILFDKFTKASKHGTGGEASTGLGLSITKTLVERHGGDIQVTSRLQRGSLFRVSLPIDNT